jgi:hypothetical protein
LAAISSNCDGQEARLWLERAIAQGIADAEPDLAGLRGFSALALKKTRKPARETVRQA